MRRGEKKRWWSMWLEFNIKSLVGTLLKKVRRRKKAKIKIKPGDGKQTSATIFRRRSCQQQQRQWRRTQDGTADQSSRTFAARVFSRDCDALAGGRIGGDREGLPEGGWSRTIAGRGGICAVLAGAAGDGTQRLR